MTHLLRTSRIFEYDAPFERETCPVYNDTKFINKNYLHVWKKFVTKMRQKFGLNIHNLHELLIMVHLKFPLI